MTKSIYICAFGDYWEHEIVVEGILPDEQELQHPVCIEGERACPPKDCGGVWSYSHLLKVIHHLRHEEYAEMMEWLEGEFNPQYFDLDQVNARLKSIR